MNIRPKSFTCILPFGMSYTREVVRGVQQYLLECGYTGNFHALPIQRITPENVSGLLGDGAILFGSSVELNSRIIELGVPTINVSNFLPTSSLPSVRVDELETGRMVARHLHTGFYRTYVYVGQADAHFSQLRGRGFQDQLRDFGADHVVLDLVKLPNWDSAGSEDLSARFKVWLSAATKPIAVMTDKSELADILWNTAEALGLSVPGDVSILSVDDPLDHLNWNYTRQLTHAVLPWDQVGYEACKSLFQWIHTGEKPTEDRLVIPSRILATQSTASEGIRYSLVSRALAFLDSQEDFSMSAKDIAEQLGVSVSGLYKQFQIKLGHSFSAELKRRAMLHARNLLLQTSLPVETISARCGYEHPSAFITAFRRETGKTPRQFRHA